MPEKNIFVGLDIGTSKIAISVGHISEGLVNILTLCKAQSNGMRKGAAVDIEECVSAISNALERAEKTAGVQIDQATVGIASSGVESAPSKGVIAVSRPDGEINQADVERAIEAARVIALPPNREILHVIPRQFIIDGQEGIKDPVGMTGLRLEVETIAVSDNTSAIKNLSKCVYQAGLEINSLIYTPLATSKILLNKKQKESGVALVDIGAGTTSVTIFEEDDLIYTNVLPVGSMHLTNDLAIGLRIGLEAAEKIKLKYGSADYDRTKAAGKIDLGKFDPDESARIEKKIIFEILQARLKEIFSMIRDELKSAGKDGMLPAGAVFTGGGSLLNGLVKTAKTELNLPAQIGKPIVQAGGAVDKISSPVYASSIGLMFEAMEGTIDSYSKSSKIAVTDSFSGVIDKIRNAFKNFLP